MRRIAVVLFAAGCSHSEPFATEAPDALGPADPALPRQLTYNLGDDRAPNVTGSAVAFSRYDPSSTSPGQCVALLPAEGGTLSATFCPPLPSAADTFVSSWLEPSLSPDGTRLAFVWRRSARVSALAAWSYDLVVASADSPSVPLASRSLARLLPGDRIVNTAVELAWVTPDVVRFLAAYDSVFKVKGGGAARFTDTVTVARALMDFTVPTRELTIIPGGDGVVAWAPVSASRMWIVPDTNPQSLLYLIDGSREPTGPDRWPVPVTDIAAQGGIVAATTGLDSLYWMNPVEGGTGRILLRGRAWRLSPGGRNAVIEIERRGGDAFGAPANLWLVPIPFWL
jgi:hypothetical protein